jgi:23S rRNA (cytosine1962-C5)-methyltransferase
VRNSPLDPFRIEADVAVSPAGLRRIRMGHLWVYTSDVARDLERPGPPIVRVVDHNNKTVGHAFHSPSSQIRLRLFTRGDEVPSAELFRRRVADAIARRLPVGARGARRLVFGEADLLPSIVVDRYADFLVVQTLSSGAEALKPLLVDVLRELVRPAGIVERNDVRARLLEGLHQRKEVLWGSVPDDPIEIEEAGVLFLVDIRGGQKTGFFLDHSENRVTSSGYIAGRALDCFTNTGAFALHFAARCQSVLGIDVSAESLEQARRNAGRNGRTNVEFREANAFDFLRDLDRGQERFDAVCLDPPAFAKNRMALRGAKAGYKEINLRAMKILRPDGVLITSSCSYHLSEADFLELLVQAARDAHRYVQIVERRSQAHDHPVLSSMPETHYLKCFILRVL